MFVSIFKFHIIYYSYEKQHFIYFTNKSALNRSVVVDIIKPCILLLHLCYLGKDLRGFFISLVGVAPQVGLHAHVLFSEVLHALFCLDHLLLCHALEGFLTVLVHMDGELVDKVFGLYVGSIRLQNMPITT